MEDTNNSWIGPVFSRFLKTLELSERAPRAQLRRYQEGLLRHLVRHARDTVPFYRDRLSCLFDGDEVDLSRWEEVPIVTRAMAVAHHDHMLSNNIPPQVGIVHESVTTGTTGKSLRVSYNELNKVAANAALARTARWWGIDTSRTTARIVIFLDDDTAAYPAGRDTRGWCFSHPDSLVHELDMLATEEDQIEWLLRKRPTYLSTSPFNATALAHKSRAGS